VREGDLHFYNELGTLKLMNLQINTRYIFHYLKNTASILDKFYIKNVSDFIRVIPKNKDHCISLIRTLD